MFATNQSLYKVTDTTGKVYAFITAPDAQQCFRKYHTNGGTLANPIAERLTFGFPDNILTVLA